MSDKRLAIGVLISGRGTNLQSIIDACLENKIHAELRVVISNKAEALGLQRAMKAHIPTVVHPYIKGESRQEAEQKIIKTLKDYGVQLVVLAGFMKIITPYFISQFKNRIINIHPSLLPAFPGIDSQKQALEYGVKVTGCTVHIVDEGCDTGPILLQAAVPVEPDDSEASLSQRILEQEHKILPKAIDLFAQNKVKIVGRKISC